MELLTMIYLFIGH